MYGIYNFIGLYLGQIWDKLLDPNLLTSPFWAVILLAVGIILSYKLVKWLFDEKFDNIEKELKEIKEELKSDKTNKSS